MGVNWGLSRRAEPREALGFLREQLIECDAGVGAVVMISGGMATGKTQLYNELLDQAKELGILTLSATGAADERAVAGGAIDQLLASGGLPDSLSERYAETSVDGSDGTDLIAELCSSLHRLAHDRAMLIAIDDLHLVDEQSLRLLLRLQRRTRSASMLMVLTVPEQPHGDGWDVADTHSFVCAPHQHVQLTPLRVDTIAELLGDDSEPQLPQHIHELSAGNPLLVNALIDDHRAGAGEHRLTGAAYSEAVQILLHRYGSPLREVATAMAVLDSDTGMESVATVASVSQEAAEIAAGILTGTGLVDGGRFRQARTATAVLDGLHGKAKTELHLRAAEVKRGSAVAASEVARHLVAAGRADAEWGIPVLTEAAEHAMLTDEVEFATRCLRLAALTSTDPQERRAIAQRLAEVTWRVNPSAAVPHLESLRAADREMDKADWITQARQSLWYGDRDGVSIALNALAAASGPVDPRTVIELTLACQWHYGTVPAAPKPGDDSMDPWQFTASTLAQVWRAGGNETTSASAERILQNCRLSDTSLEALATAILALAFDNRDDRADGWCTSLREEAEYRGAATWKAMLDAINAGLTLRKGDVTTAAKQAEAALGRLNSPNWGVSISYPLATLLSAHTEAGAFKSAAAVLRRPTPDTMLDTIGGLRYLRARGHFHLATNRMLAAISDFQQCQKLMREWDIDLPALIPWRTDLAATNLRLGNPSLAVELAKEQLARSEDTDYYSRGLALRVLAFAGDNSARAGLLSRAAECFKACGDRLEFAKTMRALGQVGQRIERPGGMIRPVTAPRPAAMMPNRQAPVPAQHVQRPPAPPAPVQVPTPAKSSRHDAGTLSEAELRVAQLAAVGHTNRQIAETLYITVSTVEQHLTRVYRKLGVSGRGALPGGLAGTGQATEAMYGNEMNTSRSAKMS